MTFLKVLVKILLLIQIFFAMIDVVDFPSPSIVLCRFGAIFNMARLLVDDFRRGFENGPWWQRLLNGYTITTWMVVLNLGSTGLLVSWLMKYADNIVKVTDCKARLSFEPFSFFLLFHYRPPSDQTPSLPVYAMVILNFLEFSNSQVQQVDLVKRMLRSSNALSYMIDKHVFHISFTCEICSQGWRFKTIQVYLTTFLFYLYCKS